MRRRRSSAWPPFMLPASTTSEDLGAIAPGFVTRYPDRGRSPRLQAPCSIYQRKLIAEEGTYLGTDTWMRASLSFPNTVNIPQINSAEDFIMYVPEDHKGDTITVNVMTPRPDNGKLRTVVPTELPRKGWSSGHLRRSRSASYAS